MKLIQIEGYIIKEKIYDDKKTLVYRGVRKKDELPVTIKILKSEYPSMDDIEKLRYEYKISKKIDGEEVLIIYDVIGYRKAFALIMTDCRILPKG